MMHICLRRVVIYLNLLWWRKDSNHFISIHGFNKIRQQYSMFVIVQLMLTLGLVLTHAFLFHGYLYTTFGFILLVPCQLWYYISGCNDTGPSCEWLCSFKRIQEDHCKTYCTNVWHAISFPSTTVRYHADGNQLYWWKLYFLLVESKEWSKFNSISKNLCTSKFENFKYSWLSTYCTLAMLFVVEPSMRMGWTNVFSILISWLLDLAK